MKISLDKFILYCLIFSCVFIISCNNCPNIKSDDYKENINLFDKIVDDFEILDNESISAQSLENKLTVDKNVILHNLGFVRAEKIKDVIIFSFSFNSEDSFIDKKIDDKLKTNTSNKKCNHYLFFSLFKNQLERVSHFENYSECRKNYEKFNERWVYSSQIWDCND